jgi:hypothetical protein
VVEAIDSLVDLLIDLLTNASGQLADAIDLIADTAATLLRDGGIALLNAFPGSIREDQALSNPFDPPEALSDPTDGLSGIGDYIAKRVQLPLTLDDFTIDDYVQFASGWYGGYVLSYFADDVIAVALAPLTGGGSLIAGLAGTLVQILNNPLIGTLGTVLNRISIADEIIGGVNILDDEATPGLVTGLKELSHIRNIQVANWATTSAPAIGASTFERIGSNPEVERGESARFLTRYLGATGNDGVDTLGTANPIGTGPATEILRPAGTNDARFQRILVSGQASGELSDAQVEGALSTIDSASVNEDERQVLASVVAEGGTDGAAFLAASSPSTAATMAGTLVSERQPIAGPSPTQVTYEDEFEQLVRQAGGENTSEAVDKLGPGTVVDLLRLDVGAGAVARANLVKALADGTITASEAETFINEMQTASLDDREQRLNDLAYSSNSTEAAEVITADD